MLHRFLLFSVLLLGAVAAPSGQQTGRNDRHHHHYHHHHHTRNDTNNSSSNECVQVDNHTLCLVPLQLLQLNITDEERSAINDIKNLFDFDHLKAIIQPLIDSLTDEQLKCEAKAWLKLIDPPSSLRIALTLTDAERAILEEAKRTDNFSAVDQFMQEKIAQLTDEQRQQINDYFEQQREYCQDILGVSEDAGEDEGVDVDPESENDGNNDEKRNANRPGTHVIGGRPNH